jgi:hypothetical protein
MRLMFGVAQTVTARTGITVQIYLNKSLVTIVVGRIIYIMSLTTG